MSTATRAMGIQFLNIYLTFFMTANEWMHPNYHYRFRKHLFCNYAKFHKHISPIYYKPDVQSLKLYCRSSNRIFSQLVYYSRIPRTVSGFNLAYASGVAAGSSLARARFNPANIGHIVIIILAFYSAYCLCEPSEIYMIFEPFLHHFWQFI